MLRSSTAHLLQRPLVLTSIASRSFIVAAPTVWNSLSVNTRSADSFASFKRRLKFELFASTCAIYDGSPPSQRSDLCFMRPSALYKSFSSSISSNCLNYYQGSVSVSEYHFIVVVVIESVLLLLMHCSIHSNSQKLILMLR